MQVWDWGCRLAAGEAPAAGLAAGRAAARVPVPRAATGRGRGSCSHTQILRSTSIITPKHEPPSTRSSNDIYCPCGRVVDVVVGGSSVVVVVVASAPAEFDSGGGEADRGAQRHTHSPAAADCDRGATCYCVTQGCDQHHHTTTLHHLLTQPSLRASRGKHTFCHLLTVLRGKSEKIPVCFTSAAYVGRTLSMRG